jgi:hypothetical protein
MAGAPSPSLRRRLPGSSPTASRTLHMGSSRSRGGIAVERSGRAPCALTGRRAEDIRGERDAGEDMLCCVKGWVRGRSQPLPPGRESLERRGGVGIVSFRVGTHRRRRPRHALLPLPSDSSDRSEDPPHSTTLLFSFLSPRVLLPPPPHRPCPCCLRRLRRVRRARACQVDVDPRRARACRHGPRARSRRPPSRVTCPRPSQSRVRHPCPPPRPRPPEAGADAQGHSSDALHAPLAHPTLFAPLRRPRLPIVLCHCEPGRAARARSAELSA